MGSQRRNLAKRADAAVSLDSRLLDEVARAFESATATAEKAIAAASEADAAGRFEAGLRAVLAAAAANPDLTRLCLVEAPGLGVAAVDRKEAGLQLFVDLLSRELADANGRPAPPLVAEMIVGGIYEVLQRAARAGDIASMPELAGELGRLWLPALRGQ